MRGSLSRQERKQRAREDRREALRDGSYARAGKRRCRNRSVSLSMAALLFLFALAGGLKILKVYDIFAGDQREEEKRSAEVIFEDPQELREAYEKLAAVCSKEMEEDKRLKEIIPVSENEWSFVQLSTERTNSLISAYSKEGAVTKIAAVGIYQEENPYFAAGLLENIKFVMMLVLDIDMKQAESILEREGILSEGDLLLKPQIFEYQGREFIFHIAGNNEFYFGVRNKTKFVNR